MCSCVLPTPTRKPVYSDLTFLHTSGINVWYDEGLAAGHEWRVELEQRLSAADRVLFFVSRHSVESPHCLREINFALETGIPVIPIALDDSELPPGLNLVLRSVQRLDRRKYDQRMFLERLLQAARVVGGKGSHRGKRTTLWVAAGIVIAVAIAVAVRVVEEPAPTPLPRIMVVPFEDLSPDGGYAYFASGMADEIALQLAASSRLRLVSNQAVRSLAGKGVDSVDIAEQLGVDMILTGSVQRREREVRLVARLTHARTAEEMWVTSLSRPLGDVFEMQDETARSIAAIVLRDESLPGRVTSTTDLSAYDLYLQGREYRSQISREALGQAVRLFDRALEIDPDFALARADLAVSWAVRGFIFREGDGALSKALLEAERAIALDSSLADAYYAKALALMGRAQFADARGSIQRAVGLAPNHSDARFLSASLADTRGHLADAVRDYSLAMQLDPTMVRTVALGRLYYLLGFPEIATKVARRGDLLAPGYPTLYLAHLMTLMGRHDEAVELCDSVLTRDLPRAYNLCGFSALVAGDTAKAEQLLQADWERDPRAQWGPFTFAASATHLAVVARSAGRVEEARSRLDESAAVTQAAMAGGNDHWALRYNMAAIAAQRREDTLVYDWLKKAEDEGFRDYRLLEIDPAFEHLRQDLRHRTYVERLRADLSRIGRSVSRPAQFPEQAADTSSID